MKIDRRLFLKATGASTAALAANPTLAKRGNKVSGADYIALRLKEVGAERLFGVPGATCDPLFAACDRHLAVSITSSDLEAGYAADGFARIKGIAALSVTYGVGTMSMVGVVAGAYAERSPIIVINGGPHPTDLRLQREHDTYFSHSSGKSQVDLNMFKEVTAYAGKAKKGSDVARVVDKAIETAFKEKRPVYIEIGKHLWAAKVPAPKGKLSLRRNAEAGDKVVAVDTLLALARAKKPALLLGGELQRHGLSRETEKLVKKLGVPYATTMLGKSVIPESTPGYAGSYVGVRSVPGIRKFLEEADLVVALGCVFGRQYRRLATGQAKKLIHATTDQTRFFGKKKKTSLPTLIHSLNGGDYKRNGAHLKNNPLSGLTFKDRRRSLKQSSSGFNYDQLMEAVSDAIEKDHVVITDTSLSLYPAADLHIKGREAFVCNGVWQSIGFSVGAASGVALASKKKPLVVCGDGGFQMTAQGLSTLAKNNIEATVVVIDNGVYGIEQFLLDKGFFSGRSEVIPYLELNRWDYVQLAKALGFKTATRVKNARDLSAALKGARGPTFIAAEIKKDALPAQLQKRS